MPYISGEFHLSMRNPETLFLFRRGNAINSREFTKTPPSGILKGAKVGQEIEQYLRGFFRSINLRQVATNSSLLKGVPLLDVQVMHHYVYYKLLDVLVALARIGHFDLIDPALKQIDQQSPFGSPYYWFDHALFKQEISIAKESPKTEDKRAIQHLREIVRDKAATEFHAFLTALEYFGYAFGRTVLTLDSTISVDELLREPSPEIKGYAIKLASIKNPNGSLMFDIDPIKNTIWETMLSEKERTIHELYAWGYFAPENKRKLTPVDIERAALLVRSENPVESFYAANAMLREGVAPPINDTIESGFVEEALNLNSGELKGTLPVNLPPNIKPIQLFSIPYLSARNILELRRSLDANDPDVALAAARRIGQLRGDNLGKILLNGNIDPLLKVEMILGYAEAA